jgi:hypothetical protein
LNQRPALIFSRRRLERSVGKAHGDEWVLRFERQKPPSLHPFTGWTECDDPQAQVELTFASRIEAIGCAEHQGLAWRVIDGPAPAPPQQHTSIDAGEADRAETAIGTVVSLAWHHNTYGSCHRSGMPAVDKALLNPAAVFSSPDEVVRHPLLTIDCKREILWRWAWDEYLLDLALAEGMPEGEPSRLPEVRAALRLLSLEWSPDPAAPAAIVVRYEHHEHRLAA